MTKTYRLRYAARAALVSLVIVLPNSLSAQTLREQIIGSWKLVSWTRTVEGKAAPAFGGGPIGMQIYTSDGHFCSAVMRAKRSAFAVQKPLGGTTDERATAYAGYIGYCGRFEVNEQERSVLHHLVVSWYPGWTGTTQKRFAEIRDGRLIFTFPILVQGVRVVGTFTYERDK